MATAGHVDHGKSTLVRALTGMEPDRWAEERRRGHDDRPRLRLDDAARSTTGRVRRRPGARALRDARCSPGSGPVPATMFVVAADAGWMPQSAEHLDALHALGVRHGLLVVTRSDLADPELARDEALEHLAESSLGRHRRRSASRGPPVRGWTTCGSALDGLVGALPVARPRRRRAALGGPRVHGARRGHGGHRDARRGHDRGWATSWRCGDARPSTVRGLQALGEPRRPRVRAVARVALNLRGVGLDEVGRGDALTDARALAAHRRASTCGVGAAAGRVGRAPTCPKQVMLHVGSAAVAARVRPLSRADGAPELDDPTRVRAPCG